MKKFFLLLISLSIFSCKRYKEVVMSKFAMDTFCEIKVLTYDEEFAKKALEDVFEEVNLVDKRFGYTDESEIVKINKFAGVSKVKVSSDVFQLIEESLWLSKETNGAFDITIGCLLDLWGFENFSSRVLFKVPSYKEILDRLKLVGYNKIILDKNESSVFLKYKGMKINLGGIAKGYALKLAKDKLLNYGFKDFLINFGGDIYTYRTKKETPWKVAVQHPRKKDRFLTVLELDTISCATSGDYERFFIKEGQRYHHILDPKTGYPKGNVISVTVMCEDPALADALATAIFVLGEVEGIEVAKRFKADCIIIKEEHNNLKIFTTDALKNIKFEL